MAEQNDDGRVSREAHDRVTTERDALKQQVAELSAVVKDVGIRDKARDFFRSKGAADPDWAAEMVLPHLRGVEADKLAEILASDRFSRFGMRESPADSEEAPDIPVDSRTGFAGGPSPASPGQPPSPQKISPRSQQFREAVRRNDRAQLDQWEREGLIDWDSRVLAQEQGGR